MTKRLSATVIVLLVVLAAGAFAVMHERTPRWAAELYRTLAAALAPFPAGLESDSAFDVRGRSKVRIKG